MTVLFNNTIAMNVQVLGICNRCTLAQANQQIQRLDTDLKQACKIAASEKQEMLQEVERLTSQWRDLSVAAAGEKQELVKEVQKLNDELSEVTETAALEKQEIRDEVFILSRTLWFYCVVHQCMLM